VVQAGCGGYGQIVAAIGNRREIDIGRLRRAEPITVLIC
jgi:hypothetical protein